MIPVSQLNKLVGINPTPCGQNGEPVSPMERRNWMATLQWNSLFADVAVGLEVIDPVTGAPTDPGKVQYTITNNLLNYMPQKFRLTATLTKISDGGTGTATAVAQEWSPTANANLGGWVDVSGPTFTVVDHFDFWSGASGDEGWCRRYVHPLYGIGQGVASGQGAAIIWMKSSTDTPTVAKIVQVYHNGTAGHLKAANASSVHPGRIITFTNGTKATGASIWILFVDHYDDDGGAVIAEEQRYYGPAIYQGTLTVSSDVRPLYACHVSEHEYLAQYTSDVTKGDTATFKLYHTTSETDSGLTRTAQCKFNAYTANKWAIVSKINDVWYANQVEC